MLGSIESVEGFRLVVVNWSFGFLAGSLFSVVLNDLYDALHYCCDQMSRTRQLFLPLSLLLSPLRVLLDKYVPQSAEIK